MVKRVSIIMCISLLCGLFSGCYDKREIDDMAYVMAIGLEKGKTNLLKMTFQIAVPKNIGGEGSSGEKVSTIMVVETPTIYSGINMVNTSVNRQVNLSHAKVVVFSEELAKTGDIHQYIHAIQRGREFRPTLQVAISEGSTEDYIRSVSPTIEINPAKYYELAFGTFKFTGFEADSKLHKFYSDMESTYKQPIATMVGVNRFKSSDEFDLEGSTYREKGREYPLEGDFRVGSVPKTGDVKSSVMGLAVFDKSKMVGELDGEESTYYLMTSGEYEHSYFSIPDPKVKERFVLLDIKQSRKPKYNVQINGDKPQIDVEVKLEADILSIQSGINYEELEKLGILESAAESFIKKGINNYLNKTSKEFGCDINGFGSDVKKSLLTWKQWEEINWLNKYKNSSFNVDVDLKIRRPGLMIRTVSEHQIEEEK